MAWQTIATIYRRDVSIPESDRTYNYYEIDDETTELNTDLSKYIVYNGFRISKSVVAELSNNRGGIGIFVIKDTPGAGYVRLKSVNNHQGTTYDYFTPNYQANGIKAYIIDFTMDGITVPITNGVGYATLYESAVTVQSQDVIFAESLEAYYAMMAYITDVTNGGGATHIAKVPGLLSALSANLSDILLVSGGGGGSLLTEDGSFIGADAGGISGNGNLSGNQITGYAFGQGESGGDVPSGGGGLYGGYKGNYTTGGGAGSGYIGNPLVTNKKMVGYNVPTSSATSTKTESTTKVSSLPESNHAKMGNGFARITWASEPDYLLAENNDYITTEDDKRIIIERGV